MNAKATYKNRGFTLVELIIAMAIMAMLLTAVVVLMSNNSIIFKKNKSDIRVQTSAEEALNTVSDILMQAKYLEVEASTTSGGTAITYVKKPYTATDSGKYFDDLYDESTKQCTTIYPTKIKATYTVSKKTGSTINDYDVNAYIYFRETTKGSSNVINMYVGRECTSLPEYNDIWTGDFDDDVLSARESWLYSDMLDEVTMTVNPNSQAVGMKMVFKENNRSYTSESMTYIRNSYVTTDKVPRLSSATDATPSTP